MNRDFQDINRIDAVSDFMDLLNVEKKPQIIDDYEEDMEMMQLFETVRAVKRLKSRKIEAKDEDIIKESKPVIKSSLPYRRITAIAAVFIIMFISAKFLNVPQNNLISKKNEMEMPENAPARTFEASKDSAADIAIMQDAPKNMTSAQLPSVQKSEKKVVNPEVKKNEVQSTEDPQIEEANRAQEVAPQESTIAGIMEAPQAKMFSGNNIIYAMDRAYEGLMGYSAYTEISYMDNSGKVNYMEKIEIKYKKPDKYMAVIKKDDKTVTKISDGEKVYIINSDQVTVNYLSSDEEVWKYLIGESIGRFKKTSNFIQIGDEIIGGKEAFIYEFNFSDDRTLNKIWIDKVSNLPVKQELNMPDGTKIISQLVSLDINPSLDDSIFKYEIKDNQKVNYE